MPSPYRQSKMMNVAITGGAGFIGQALIQRLQMDAVQLRLLSRKKLSLPRAGLNCTATAEEYFIADLTKNTDSLDGFFDGIDVIYHCAGELNNNAVMRSLHVDGTANLLQAVKNYIDTTQQALHWVQLSSVGAYGAPKGRPDTEREVVETTPTAPQGEYEVTKTLADEMVIQFAKTQPLFTYTILRPSNVIGKKMTNQSVRSLVNIIKKKHFFYIGSRSTIATYIHVDDVADALVLCGTEIQAREQIVNLSNDCRLSEIVNAVAKKAGIPSPTLCFPEQPIRLLAKLLSLIGKSPLTQSRIDALMNRTSYPNKKIKELLSFAPRYSIPHTIATLFDEDQDT